MKIDPYKKQAKGTGSSWKLAQAFDSSISRMFPIIRMAADWDKYFIILFIFNLIFI